MRGVNYSHGFYLTHGVFQKAHRAALMDKILLGEKRGPASHQKTEVEDGGARAKEKSKKKGALVPVPPEIAEEVTCDV